MTTAQTNQSITTLFCKPSAKDIVYKKRVEAINTDIAFRSLNLETDLDLIHQWVNAAYSRRFWQLNETKNVLKNIYRSILANPVAHSFIGIAGEKPFCQVDVYLASADELHEHIEVNPNDAGMHLLMCPPKEMKRHWTRYAIKSFQEYFFSFENAGILYAEPDQENHTANQLAINSGFQFMKTINLSNKTANLYSLTREQFDS